MQTLSNDTLRKRSSKIANALSTLTESLELSCGAGIQRRDGVVPLINRISPAAQSQARRIHAQR
jgi:hypothetical protein